MNDSPDPRPIMQSPPRAETVIAGRRYLYFVGTGYMDLQGHPEVIEAACAAMRQLGISGATTRTDFLGNTQPLIDVERLAAEFFGTEEAYYFVSGYLGNQILVRALKGTFNAVFADESSHFSVMDAAETSGCPVVRFANCDPSDLQRRLDEHLRPRGRPLVMTDGVFAVSGKVAPLDEYARLLNRYAGATLQVDDAHGVAVLGEHGRGTLEHHRLWPLGVNGDLQPGRRGGDVRLVFCGTLSKAFGGFGGIIPGTRRFIARARSASHYHSGASEPPIAAAAATARAIGLLSRRPEMRENLRRNVRLVREGLRDCGLDVEDTPSPVIGLRIGDAANMRRIERQLRARGILVKYMESYAGVGPEGVLRISVFATHTAEMIEKLIAAMQEAL